MALWGNKDLVYNDGTIAVNFDTKQVTGTVGVVTFTTSSSGINTGAVITVGAGATYGYAVITGGITSTTMNIDSTSGFVVGLTTVPAGASYAISEEPLYTITDSGYIAPEAKAAADATKTGPDGYTKLFTSSIYGVDTTEVGVANTATGDARKYAPAHAGWVGVTTYMDMHGNLRVKTETFVAMSADADGNGGIQNDADGSIIADDTQYPDTAS
jgi:hypothetical protein